MHLPAFRTFILHYFMFQSFQWPVAPNFYHVCEPTVQPFFQTKVDNLKKVGNSEDQSMITIQQTDIDIDEIQDRLDLLEESIQELKLPITNEEQYKIVSFYFFISIYVS